MKSIACILALCAVVTLELARAQTVQITGAVISSVDGTSVPGATILVKGTTLGTVTNDQGRFSLNIPSGSNFLVVSFVGMRTQEVEIGGRSHIDIQLEADVMGLDEVVVTALGITRERRSLGYSIQEAKGDELTRSANPDLQTSLAGKFSGVEVRQSSGMPGAPSQIYIRGARAFSGNNSPLYVVDGMPITSENDYGSNVTGTAYANRALDIDPNDIESVNILKGQAAAALYGLRASNGVIIITTKKGAGVVGKPLVSISSNYTIDKVATLPEVQQTYAQGTSGIYRIANSFSWGPKISDLPKNDTYGGNNFSRPGQYFDAYKGQWVSPKAYNNPENFYSSSGQTFNNSINISNANELGNYSLGFGSTNQTGIVRKTGMDRYYAKMAGDFNLNSRWSMGFSGNLSDSKIDKLPSGNDSWLFTVYGAPPSFDLIGTPYHQEGVDGPYRQISYREGYVGKNPNWVIENNKYTEATKRFFGNGYLDFKPTTWANLRYQIGMDMYTTDNAEYTEAGTYDLPTAAQYPTPTNLFYAYVEPTGGVIQNYGLTRRVVNSLLTATFKHDFSQDLKATLLVGNEIDHNSSSYYDTYGANFTTPGWNNLSNTNVQQANYAGFERRTFGIFANLNIDYKDLLFFNSTIRQDIVSSMPRGNRTFAYPSASLAYVFTSHGALKNNQVLSFGKARLSYAEVGQASMGYSPSTYYVKGGASSGFIDYGIIYPFRGVSGYKLTSTLYDPNLIPQNTRSVEFGLDLRFFQNRVGLDYSYFNQLAINQIFPVPMAGSTGYSQIVMNAGEMKGVGHEIILTLVPVQKRNFEWHVGMNYTKIVNTVVELAPGVESISLGGYVTPNIRASAGDTYPSIYGDAFKRDAQGRILVDDDPNSRYYGMPMVGDFQKIGDVSPDFIMGLSSRVVLFRGITLFAQMDWKQGGQIYSGSNRLMDLYGTSKRTEERDIPFIYDGYRSNGRQNNIRRGIPGDETAWEILYTEVLDAIDENAIYETSFVKLRELGVSINLPRVLISPLRVQSASIGFVARNILLWSTLPYFDPEASQGQGNMQGGFDYMSLPQTTSYGFSLNLTF